MKRVLYGAAGVVALVAASCAYARWLDELAEAIEPQDD